MQPGSKSQTKQGALIGRGRQSRLQCSTILLQSNKLLRQWFSGEIHKKTVDCILYPLMNPVFRDPMRFPVASDAAISAQNMAKALETLTEQKVS